MSTLVSEAHNEAYQQENLLLFVLFSTVTVLFSIGVITKFFTDDFHLRFRALLSLLLLFIGEPICHFIIQGFKGLSIYTISCAILYMLLPASHLKVGGQVILIAGPFSRFLSSLLKDLDKKNITVYVCLPKSNKEQAGALQSQYDKKIKVFVADLSATDQAEFVQHQLRQDLTHEASLWGLVLLPSPLSNGPIMNSHSFASQLHTSVAAASNMIRALAPHMAKEGGRVVLATTSAARLPVSPTRHAASVQAAAHEQLAHTIRRELRPRGLRTALVWLPDDVSDYLLTSEELSPRATHRQFSVEPDLVTKQALHAVHTALFSRNPRPTSACFLRDEAFIWLWGGVPTRLADFFQLGPNCRAQ